MLVAGDYGIPWDDGQLGRPQPMITDSNGQPYSTTPVVACSSERFCLDATASDEQRYAAWNGSTWTTKPSPLTAPGLAAIGGGQVSCSADGRCMAITGDGSTGQATVGTWTGSRWATTPVGLDDGGVLSQITCSQVNYCLLLDNGGQVRTYRGNGWSAPQPVSASDSQGAQDMPAHLTCVPGPFCLASGQNGGAVLEDHGEGFAPVRSLPPLYNEWMACTTAAYCLVKRVSNEASAPVQALVDGTTLHHRPRGSAATAHGRRHHHLPAEPSLSAVAGRWLDVDRGRRQRRADHQRGSEQFALEHGHR